MAGSTKTALKKKLDEDTKAFQHILQTNLANCPDAPNAQTEIEKLGNDLATASRSIMLDGKTQNLDDIQKNAYGPYLSYLIAYLDVMFRLNILPDSEDITTLIYHYSVRVLDEYECENSSESGDSK